MLNMRVRFMGAFWSVWNGLTGYRWVFRCNGYRQIGRVNGERTHMAQYCYRIKGHRGRCLARVNARAEMAAAYFDDEGEM